MADWAGDDLEERWRSRLRDVPLNVIAFTDDDHGIGQVSCTALDQVGCAELISMWVDPSARGRGVGEALIAEVTNWAQAQAAAAVVLSVKVGNHAAIDLYRRMSFVPTDEPADDGELRMRLQLASRSERSGR